MMSNLKPPSYLSSKQFMVLLVMIARRLERVVVNLAMGLLQNMPTCPGK
jgi:hypothetical protein